MGKEDVRCVFAKYLNARWSLGLTRKLSKREGHLKHQRQGQGLIGSRQGSQRRKPSRRTQNIVILLGTLQKEKKTTQEEPARSLREKMDEKFQQNR